jgi:hypothetical protein
MISVALGGSKQPIASGLAGASLDRLSTTFPETASILAVFQIVLLVALLLLSARVGQTIDVQHRAVEETGARIASLIEHNEVLRLRLSREPAHSAETHDTLLHGFGLQLRDRVAREVADAFGELASCSSGGDVKLSRESHDKIRMALELSLNTIRTISPDLAGAESGQRRSQCSD